MIRQHIDTSRKKWKLVFIGLFVLLAISFLLNMLIGSVIIPPANSLKFLFSGDAGEDTWTTILLQFRLPKAITAIMAGSALGVSGLQMQTLFRNPLAGPYILGISSGAGLGVAVVIFLGVSMGIYSALPPVGRSWLLIISAGFGSFSVLSVIGMAAMRVRSSISLLLIGLMIGSAVSALIGILQYFSQAENIRAYVLWSFGNLGSLSWQELWIVMPFIFTNLVIAVLLSKRLNVLLLGETYAESLGLNLKLTRLLIIINTSVLAGTITAFCGPIAFVGLAIPHLARMLFNTANHLQLTPIVILIGSIAMLLFDVIAQMPGSDKLLPINAVTSLLGAPFVVWLIIRKNNLHYSFDR
jgi:iron complex transport system permease protein